MLELRKIAWMIKKEWLTLKRHPTRLASILVFPIIMILLCGYEDDEEADSNTMDSDRPIDKRWEALLKLKQ